MPGSICSRAAIARLHSVRTVIFRFVSSIALACAIAPLAQADTPHLLMDINAQTNAINSYPTPLGHLGSSYFFGARTSQTANPATSALFITDFTAAGTVAIKTFAGTGPSDIAAPQPRFLVAGNRAYFVAVEDVGVEAVWVTDGHGRGHAESGRSRWQRIRRDSDARPAGQRPHLHATESAPAAPSSTGPMERPVARRR